MNDFDRQYENINLPNLEDMRNAKMINKRAYFRFNGRIFHKTHGQYGYDNGPDPDTGKFSLRSPARHSNDKSLFIRKCKDCGRVWNANELAQAINNSKEGESRLIMWK